MPNSLAYFKFRKSLERDIRSYWSISISTSLTNKWLQQFDQQLRLTQIADNAYPYSQVDIKGIEFLGHLPLVLEHSRENALVNFITAFEVYLFEILSRVTYLDPANLETSDMKFEAKDIVAGLKTKNFKQWFSTKFTDKTVRNKQHIDIITKIARFGKFDIKPIQGQIDNWNKWTYVRNAIVHTGRRVSSDLNNIWAVRFPAIDSPLNLQDNEIMKVQALANTIAKYLDTRISQAIVKLSDATLVVRELFIRYGTDDHAELRTIVQRNLGNRLTRQNIEQILAYQRRTNADITEIDFNGTINDLKP